MMTIDEECFDGCCRLGQDGARLRFKAKTLVNFKTD